MNKKLIFCWLASLISVLGCKDEAEQIPAYLELKPFTVNAPGGAAWHKLPFSWVYVNGNFVGAYSPGKPFPVLAEGESTVIVFPGVNQNGISETPDIYPFLLRYETKVTLTPGQTTTIQPTTSYDPSGITTWATAGEFDGTTISFENLDTDSETSIVFDQNGAFSGRSARMELDTAHPLMIVATEWLADLPTTGGRDVWLEMHYRNDAPFEFYLDGRSPGEQYTQPVYLFQVKENWNKIYFHLTPFLIENQFREYRLLFRFGLPKDGSGNFAQQKGTVQLDNFKLIYF